MTERPVLTQFRLEDGANGVAHLVFDCPGRTMNVFSDAAIVEIGRVAEWLAGADVAGLVIRSGKTNAFCAGADLTELGLAYDMIAAAPAHSRFNLAADHFFRLSLALRALETADRPVACAVAGLALGGGCELALAAHHRVLVDAPGVAIGLPESLVGLLPGAGGTQRLPRLLGVEAAMPVLLDGARLAGADALAVGLVDALAAPGTEVVAAEAWVLGTPEPVQPWDRDGWTPAAPSAVEAALAPVRARVLAETLGHYPAPLAILDCVGFGLPQPFDGAIRSENAIFAHLIQRREARDMIATMFLAKTEYDRLARRNALPPEVAAFLDLSEAVIRADPDAEALADAGFVGSGAMPRGPVRARTRRGYWLDEADGARSRAAVDRVTAALVEVGRDMPADQRALADYGSVVRLGYPAYLGGPFARAAAA